MALRPWEVVAQLEVHLMVEFLASSEERPDWKEAVWVCNAPRGPARRGVRVLQRVIEEYGQANVTTGNAQPPSSEEVGIYVRPDVMGDEENFLRRYLSEG